MKQPQLVPKRNTQSALSSQPAQLKEETMNEFTSFEDILNVESTDVERPRPMPQGTYICMIQGLPRFDKSSEKQTPFVEFMLKPIDTFDDVDKEELASQGGLGDKTLPVTFYLTQKSLWRLNDFLDNCGIEQGKMNWRVDQTPNCQVGAVVKHVPSKDGTVTYANVAKTISL